MLCWDETLLVKEGNMFKLERNDAKMVRWMCSVTPEERVSVKG